jgi:hypothetical protein
MFVGTRSSDPELQQRLLPTPQNPATGLYSAPFECSLLRPILFCSALFNGLLIYNRKFLSLHIWAY